VSESDAPTVGVVVPAYNPDIEVLSTYLDEIVRAVDPDTLRVELDGQSGAERLAATPAEVAVSTERRGKGKALTEGFDALDTDVLAFVDADGATPAPQLARVVDTVTDGGADLAVGSRRHPDATVENSQSRLRTVMGDSFAWLARRLLGVSLYDYQCGAKALTAAAWDRIRPGITERGFAWDVELLGLAGSQDLRIQEVPVTWHDHPDSTVSPVRTGIDLGRALVRTRLRTAQTTPPRGATAFSDGLARLLEDQNSEQ